MVSRATVPALTLSFRPSTVSQTQRYYAIMTRAKRRAGINAPNTTPPPPPKTSMPPKLTPLSDTQQEVLMTPKTSRPPETIALAKSIHPKKATWAAGRPLIGALKPVDTASRMIKIRTSFEQPQNPHLVKVAVLGAANAGKSTLVNQIVGEQISIVSPKAHTTRERVLAVCTQDNKQIVFLDTPGVIPGRNRARMNRELVNASWHSLNEADHRKYDARATISCAIVRFPLLQYSVMVVVDVAKVLNAPHTFSDDYLFERLQAYSMPATLIINKMDLLTNKSEAESVAKKFTALYPHFKRTIFVSALDKAGDGLLEVKDGLFAETVSRDWLFPADQRGEMSDLRRVEEFIRAEFFKSLHQYLPYMLKQENVGWTDLPDGSLRIDQIVIVERDSQHKIVVGSDGAVIRKVTTDARREIGKALRRRVQLFIQVKTRGK
ncbi:P-loop containing nucleoside triphosphate hydrolase protein [Jimgerdemannia flammicorona]|uniref:P-loop containing nucleoside triphosphate hydrolase protein n=1 Tax=Jimgerdemannia flammicorona TaxID=994334 RepID=A0A433QYC7_9FUNG|nr:P-loop containing nucleoside triphosphate hydrolase protein [Jimgerdemannia flammicorona]